MAGKTFPTYYLVANDGNLKVTDTTIVFPWSSFTNAFSAMERDQTEESKENNIQFVNGIFTPVNDVQNFICSHYHTGGVYKYGGKERTLRPTPRFLFTITDEDPKVVGDRIKKSRGTDEPEVRIEKVVQVPRIFVETQTEPTLIEYLAKIGLPIGGSPTMKQIIDHMEQNNLISD